MKKLTAAVEKLEGFVAELEAAPPKTLRMVWTKEDEATLRRYYPLGKDPRLIGKCMRFPKTVDAVHSKARSLELRFGSALKGEGQ